MKLRTKLLLSRKIAALLFMIMIADMFMPAVAYALTSGSSQPEATGFQSADNSNLVDLFTGDFTYNIPLFELPGPNGGYPFNLSYSSGIGMEQEASWVGLGWSLNAGALNRNMRGIPDDFRGDLGDNIHITARMKNNWTAGIRTSANLEIFGADKDKLPLKLGLSAGIYYNSYKGVGANFGAGVSFDLSNSNSSNAGFGLNLTMDSQEGTGLAPSLSLNSKENEENGSYGSLSLGIGINSKRGLSDVSLGVSAEQTKQSTKTKKDNKTTFKPGDSFSNSVSFTPAATAFMPYQESEYKGSNLSITFKAGGDIFGVFGNAAITGYYSEQHLSKKSFDTKPFGYLNFHHGADEESSVMDLNREKDGMIRFETPNMPIPSTTYDTYNISGQGTGGTIRPYRSDLGQIFDRRTKSKFHGGGIGVKLGGGGLFKVGSDLSQNFAYSSTSKWDTQSNNYEYGKDMDSKDAAYEPYYYKLPGELTSEPLGYYDYIANKEVAHLADNELIGKSNKILVSNAANSRTNAQDNIRKPRTKVIQSFSNDEILSSANDALISEFAYNYYTGLPAVEGSNYENDLSGNAVRSGTKNGYDIGHHMGGYAVTEGSGLRYIYGLPVYNLEQRDEVFSANPENLENENGEKINDPDDPAYDANNLIRTGTYEVPSGDYWEVPQSDNYLRRTEMSPYSTSHLLTCILGSDYVDLTEDGPTDDDLGYWVKFNYIQTSASYPWRAPYSDANYIRGGNSQVADDKASFMYGEKEIYYLAEAETKTHIAVFRMTPREDGKSASTNVLEGGKDATSVSQYKLNKIELFEKDEYKSNLTNATPIQTVNLEFNNGTSNGMLCDEIPNANTGGKLTLTKVWFEYLNSTKGENNAYAFSYEGLNPGYDKLKQDRYGYFKNQNFCSDAYGMEFPYQKQFNDLTATNPTSTSLGPLLSYDPDGFREKVDSNKAAWSLTNIVTPTGSEIEVEYESDDYGYVQDRQATQMFEIVNTGYDKYENGAYIADLSQNQDSKRELFGKGFNVENTQHMRIYFQLEHPISTELTPTQKKEQLNNYFDGLYNGATEGSKQLYFKSLIDIRSKKEAKKGYEEIISGYVDVKHWGLSNEIGQIEIEDDNGQLVMEDHHIIGWVQLEPTVIKNNEMKHHPFSLAAWQYLRTNLSSIENLPNNIRKEAGTSSSAKAAKAKSLITMIPDMFGMFTNYYERCKRQRFASQLDCGNSVIKLCSPDFVKIGGGIRVKSISITDDTAEGGPVSYGSTYNYVLENGHTSGVAAYEPIVGGDEIALRRAKIYPESIKLKTNNNLYFEYPINESYFPGPTVGYSRVEVKSLAVDTKMNGVLGISINENKYGTTGLTVNEFYTAKDFPIITDFTIMDKSRVKGTTYVPFIGMQVVSQFKAFQGYKIELNDMHGKSKATYNYGLKGDGSVINNPVSWVKYNYLSKAMYHEGNSVNQLVNTVETLVGDGEFETREMGVDYDFVVDSRKSFSFSENLGVNLGGDGLPILGITIPSALPNLGTNTNSAKFMVTNKIINRSGIVSSVEAYDGQSKVITSNEYFDALTGEAILTVVNNNYDRPIYNYSIPAHWQYEGMGAAYRNAGLKVITDDGDITLSITNGSFEISKDLEGDLAYLFPGDRIVFSSTTIQGAVTVPRTVGYVTNADAENNLLSIQLNNETLTQTENNQNIIITVIQSGHKNQLSAKNGSILALKNPLVDRDLSEYCELDPSATVTEADIEVFDDCVDEMFEMINYILEQGQYDDFASGGIDLSTHPYNTYEVCNPYAVASLTTTCVDVEVATIEQQSAGESLIIEGEVIINDSGDMMVENPISTNITEPNYPANTIQICYDVALNMGGCVLKIYDADGTNQIPLSQIETFFGQPAFVSNTASIITGTIYARLVNENVYRQCQFTYENCDLPTETISVSGLQLDNCEAVKFEMLDEVINATATKYLDCWPLDKATTTGDTYVSLSSANAFPYKYGAKGIWRPLEAYTYVEDRDEIVNGEVDLIHDGSYDNMPMFQWDNPFFFADECIQSDKWINSGTITKYNGYNHEIENKNPLDIYSAALYGYDGKMQTAVSANAEYYEFGFESFEEYNQTNSDYSDIHKNGNGNLDFLTNYTKEYQRIVNVYDLARSPNASDATWVVDPNIFNNLVANSGRYSYVIIGEAPSMPSEGIPYETRITSGEFNGLDAMLPEETFKVIQVPDLNFQGPSGNANDRCWQGKIYIIEDIDVSGPNNSNVSFSEDEAHTGEKSIKIDNDVAYFPQYLLDVNENEEYLISAWVKKDVNEHTYKNEEPNHGAAIHVRFKDDQQPSNNILSEEELKPVGKIINGWQKIEGVVSVPVGTELVEIGLRSNGTEDSNVPAFFDDIRFFPNTGSMMSYVYNPDNYRMVATLDDNNYATYYSYDERGGLFLVKKETPKGIVTIQETRAFTKEN